MVMLPYDHTIPAPSEILNTIELEETINKFGSWLSIVVNKPISCVTLFSMLRKDEQLRSFLLDLTDQSWYVIVSYMSHRWPVLNKSKKIK